MKVFISSVIAGFESYRDAAGQGVHSLGHQAIRAEDFGAAPASPQEVCLRGVRAADVVVLLVGARYGYPQASGLSACGVHKLSPGEHHTGRLGWCSSPWHTPSFARFLTC